MRADIPFFGALFVGMVSSSPYNELRSNTRAVDQFLLSIGVNPTQLDNHAKQQTGCALTCAILRSAFGDSLVTQSSNQTLYDEEADAYWSATAYKNPACMISPSEIRTLSVTVRSAELAQCKFAVRSGGHSPFAGFAGIDNGLLISMSEMTDLDYDENTQIQRSGMGNRWGDVYSYLRDKDRIVVGGRLNDVGLALATGGGLSHLSNKHGWVGQNVVTYEVMLANGAHVTASKTVNPDLYFSVKGGNNNFGIVTHLNQYTYPLGKVWGGLVTYSANYSKDFMAAIAQYQSSGQLDTDSAMLPYLAFSNDTILSTFIHLGGEEKPKAFAPFYNIPNTSDSTQVFESFYDFANGGLPSLPRWTYGAISLYLDAEAYAGLVDVVKQFNLRVHQVQSGTLVLMPQPISKTMVEQSRRKGDGPLHNVAPREQLWAAVNIGWSLESDDEIVSQILQDCIATIEDYTKQKREFDPFIFLNDAAPFQDPLKGYGKDSLQRLQSASRKYDPTGVFQRLVPGGFKVFR
ncbi:oxidase/Diels-Alderase [Xylariaceae sp. AK1471]|nr:oxidase/Diels-Alderase [Xylariaceae sp. AK1471]